MDIHFTEQEMITFLQKYGYTIMPIDTYRIATRSEEIYGGKAFVDVTVKCAFKNDYPQKEDNFDSYAWINKFGIEIVFMKEFKKKLLSL